MPYKSSTPRAMPASRAGSGGRMRRSRLLGAIWTALVSGAAEGGGMEATVTPGHVAVCEHEPLARNEEYTRLRLALLDRKREVPIRLRHQGTIDDSVARRVQTRLDIEELRLSGVEPIE